MLFHHSIGNLEDWGNIFQDKKTFEPMVKDIFRKHGMTFTELENCTPGSNAVFRVGDYIVKIFAPEESEIGGENEFITELFGIQRAAQLGIAAPKLVASGTMNDKYVFRYLVMEYMMGASLSDIFSTLSKEERIKIGQDLRLIVEKMDIPCERFNYHKLFEKTAEKRWNIFSAEFQKDRKDYLQKHPGMEEVYVHGDLGPDNILVDAEKKICIIDFADAMTAPVELELAALVCGVSFDSSYMRGFFGEYEERELAERLVYGLLLHDYGANIICDNIGKPDGIYSVGELRNRIMKKLGNRE